jgi:hypothetical protein
VGLVNQGRSQFKFRDTGVSPESILIRRRATGESSDIRPQLFQKIPCFLPSQQKGFAPLSSLMRSWALSPHRCLRTSLVLAGTVAPEG